MPIITSVAAAGVAFGVCLVNADVDAAVATTADFTLNGVLNGREHAQRRILPVVAVDRCPDSRFQIRSSGL